MLWEQEGTTASNKVKLREMERLVPGSHPASDTDDTMWEELLQEPDSPSTGSSDSEIDGRCTAGLNIQQNTTQSSGDESLQQGISSVNIKFEQAMDICICCSVILLSKKTKQNYFI